MTSTGKHFLPAAGRDAFLPLYDPLTWLLGAGRVRRRLLKQAAPEAHHHILDIGCGTGSLAVAVKRAHPGVEVTGLDPDGKALARARRKAERAGVHVRFDLGLADALAYPDATFDRVLSSFMFHHVPGDEKPKMLSEVRRVLKPGGRFHMVDFQAGDSGGHAFLGTFLHTHDRLKDNTEGRILELLTDAGFDRPVRLGGAAWLVGRIAFYRAERTA